MNDDSAMPMNWTALRSVGIAALACLSMIGALPSVDVAEAQVRQAVVSVDQAVSAAERRFKARVVRADTHRDGDRVVYVLRLLNDAGRVWTVRVDAQTGQIQ